jgi:hypothetical protein
MRLQNWFGFVKISMEQFGSLQYQKSLAAGKCQPSVLKRKSDLHSEQEEKYTDIW